MSQPIDEVYVEIHARGEKEAADDVERAARNMQRYMESATKEIEKDFARAGKEISTEISVGADTAKKAVQELADETTKSLRSIDRDARSAGESLAEGLAGGDDGGRGGLSGIVERLSQMGAQLRNISALAPPPILLALVAAIPAVLALGGALADLSALLLLLPAGIGAAVGAVAALQIAFTGVGAAVQALATGDLKKINEAMKELAPSARAVAREIFSLKKPFEDLRRTVQEAFFAPLQGDIANLGRVALPVLERGLSRIAGALGRFGSGLADLLGEVDILNDIRDVFAGTARIIDRFAPRAIDLLGVLFGVAEHGMPFLERAFDALGRGMENLTGFLGDALASGDFNRFLEDAFQIMSDLGDLTSSVFGLLGALFGDMGDEGSNFIQVLTQMIDRLTEFFNSAEGQEVLQRTVDSLKAMGIVIGVVIEALIWLARINNVIIKSLIEFGKFVVIAGKAIGDFFQTLWGWIQTAAGAVGDFFSSAGEFFSNVGGWFAGIGGAIAEAFTTLVTWITAFASWITDLENIGYVIGFMVGTAIRWFFTLRDAVNNIFIGIGKFIIGTWVTIQKFTYDTVLKIVTSVIDFFTKLPERVTGAINHMRDVISNAFKRTRDNAVNSAASLSNGVVNFFRSTRDRAIKFINDLPGNVTRIFNSLATRAFSLGRNILTGIINGIRAGYSAALDTAKRIARGILEGMKDSLGIDSPSKLAASQVGRPIMQGIGVGASDGASELRSMLNNVVVGTLPGVTNVTNNTGGGGSGGSITFDAGAVQVTFQGAVPTEAEALRTGQAVGAGIAQTIARRNVRTAVRMA